MFDPNDKHQGLTLLAKFLLGVFDEIRQDIVDAGGDELGLARICKYTDEGIEEIHIVVSDDMVIRVRLDSINVDESSEILADAMAKQLLETMVNDHMNRN